MEETPKAGRPPGKRYGVVRSIRLSERDAERVRHLAEKWELKDTDAIRRAIREASAREGLE